MSRAWSGTFDITQSWAGTVGVYEVSILGQPIGLLLALTYS